MAKGLDEQMYEILGNYDKKVEKLLIKNCREVASDASEELQKTSPKKQKSTHPDGCRSLSRKVQ